MQVNLPVWSYYPKDDKPFVDPMYVPYLKQATITNTGEVCPINTWKVQGYADGFVNPALVRKGWGMDFQLLHPDKDPCPEGWTKGSDGWCVENVPEFGDHGIYSKDAFVPYYQYFNQTFPKLRHPNQRQLNEFDMKSVNPNTGNYVNYIKSYPSETRKIYSHLPSKDSFLA